MSTPLLPRRLPVGNHISLRKRDGRTLTFAYDNLGRITSKLVPDGCAPIQPPGIAGTQYLFMGRQLTAWFDSQISADGITRIGVGAKYGPYPPDKILGGQKKSIGLPKLNVGNTLTAWIHG